MVVESEKLQSVGNLAAPLDWKGMRKAARRDFLSLRKNIAQSHRLMRKHVASAEKLDQLLC
jgi:phage FluMu protein gp41